MPRSATPRTPTDRRQAVEWISELKTTGSRRDQALAQLHAILVQAARREAARRLDSRVTGPELGDIVQQAADDALVAIMAKLDDFRGESRFTTWAYRFVVLEVASKLSRHAWRTRPTVSAEQGSWEQLPDRFGLTPAEALEHHELLEAVRVAVETKLTPRQRRVFVAIVLDAVPLDVLVAELDSNRNALYKTLFDARGKVRAHLVANGYMGF